MKYIVFFLLLISGTAYSQSTYYIRADSTRLQKVGGSNELIIENSTKNTTGVLVNNGGGRTQFYKPRLSGDTLFIGKDTLLLPAGSSFDTTTIYSNIALKLNKSDTSSMLANYFNQVGYGLLRTGQVVRFDSATVFQQIRATTLNFANANLTQTAARTYAGAGFDYDFDNLGTWIYNLNSAKHFIIQGTNLYSDFTGNDIYLQTGTGQTSALFELNSTTRGAFNMTANRAVSGSSGMDIVGDSILLRPYGGVLNINSLRAAPSTTSMKVMMRKADGGIYEIAKDSVGNSNAIITAGDLSPLFTTTETAGNINFTLSNVAPYSVYGRASGTGVPSFITGIDSNWVAGLHTENYYNTKYALTGSTPTLQQVLTAGSTLTGFNEIIQAANQLQITNTLTSSTAGGLLVQSNGANGLAMRINTNGRGLYINGSASGQTGLEIDGYSTGFAAQINANGGGTSLYLNNYFASTNTVASIPSTQSNRWVISGTAAAGIGFSEDKNIQNTSGGGNTALQHIYKYTTATSGSEVAEYSLKLRNTGSLSERFVLSGSGALKLNAYTSTSSFSGTPVGTLGFDASGNVLTMASPSGSGTVTTVSIVSANGVSGSVANATTTPAITLSLGAITPTSVAASGTVTGSNLSGTNTGDQTITLTGNVTGSGTGSFATTIANSAVTLSKMADVATGTVFYRKTAATGVPEVQTLATLKTDLGITGTNTGDQTITLTGGVTGSGTGSFATTVVTNANLTGDVTSVGNATTYNNIVGTAKGGTGVDNSTGGTANTFWARPNGATGAATYRAIVAADIPTLNQSTTGSAATLTTGRTIAMTGDVAWTSGSFNGSANVTGTSTIGANVVDNTKLAQVATQTFKGRTTAATGNVEDLTIAQAKTMLGIIDAVADGSTKGIATFTASDFNSTTGNISIDYTNGQASSTTNKGFLTNTDWNTFNGKATNPMTTLNDIIVGGASGTPVRLAVGGEGSSLTVSGGNVTWASGTSWNGSYASSSSGDFNGVTINNTTTTLLVHTGGTASSSLPLVSGGYTKVLHLVNQGTGNWTLNRQSTDNIFFQGATVTSFTLAAGSSATVGLLNSKWTVWFDGYNPNNLTTSVAASTYQPLDADLTTIAGLTATTDNFIQSKGSAWASRTVAQVKTDLGLTGTNGGDQNLFSSIPVSGQTTVTANSTTTALTLVAGTGMTITTDNTAKTITFASSGGGSGDMILANAQTNTGAKTFNNATFLLRNVANTFNGSFTNTNTADRIYTLPDAAGTVQLSNISAKSIWVANSANTITELTPGAGQSIRINPGNTAWEVYTPGSGGSGITVGTTTITGGTTGRFAYNNAGVYGETAGVVYSTTSPIVSITAPTATDVPLLVTGAASQSSNILQINSSGGTPIIGFIPIATTGGWINMSISGPSGLGHGGAGVNPWVGYVQSNGQYFTNSSAGDIIYRNTAAKLLWGNTSGDAGMALSGDKLGIGTITPDEAIHVSGNIKSTGFVELAEISAPSTARANTARIYPKSDGLFYGKDDAGVETKLSNDAGGGGMADPGGNGVVVRTALNTTINRTLTGTSNKITVTNGDGVSANPTFTIGSDVVDKTIANTYTAGAKQTFRGDATNSGVGFGGGLTANPSTLVTGDFWYRSDENKFRYYDGTTARAFVTEALAQTLTNKTIALGSNTLSGTTAQFNTALTDNDFATLDGTETITNKTFNWANNTVSMTTAQINTALSDNDITTLAGTETLTNKTLTSPVINVGSDATGDIYYRNAGVLTRLPVGANGTFLSVTSGVPTWGAGSTSTDSRITTGVVTADVSNSTVTPAKITTLDKTLGVGIYNFVYYVRYQAAATTTGIRLSVNHSGTVAWFTANIRWVDVSATASTAAATQANVGAAGAVMGSFSARAKSTAGWGTTLSVDAANSDMMAIIEGTFEVTASGDIQLYHGSEVAAASTIKAGTNLIVTKVN